MRRKLTSILAITAVVGAAAAGACANPRVDLQQWDEIQGLQNSVSELKTYSNELEGVIDSLNKILMRQDTAIRLLVDFTGAQVPAYRKGG